MAQTGFGMWTIAALGLTMLLMLTSMALQLWWRAQSLEEGKSAGKSHE